MPKLLLFAPCEKVIVDQAENTTSLITLIEAINIAVAEGDEKQIPDGARVDFALSIIALWQTTPEDEGKAFEQRFAVALPNGQEIGEGKKAAVLPIAFQPDKPNFRSIVRMLGFPLHALLEADRCLFQLFLREVGQGKEWEFIAEYPALIRRRQKIAETTQ